MVSSPLTSLPGIFFLMFTAWFFSTDRRAVNWRTVAGSALTQFTIALFLFKVPFGAKVFLWMNGAVNRVMECSTAGTKFVFGILALSPGETGAAGEKSLGFILALQALPTIIFFSALMSVLYYMNIMPRIIRFFSMIFAKTMRISGAEALVTASNIFSGVESSLTVKPYLPKMTSSELAVVLTAGMATVAANVIALYIYILKPYMPTIAGHLISASLLSAPAAILMSKILVPETGEPETLGVHAELYQEKDASLFEAVINGANAGVKMIVGVAALLLAVLGLVALLNMIVSHLGHRAGLLFGMNLDWSLKNLCGYVFYPFTLAMGVSLQDAPLIAKIVGERLIITEVASYQDLATAISQNLLQDPKSAIIATYALCGFAHVASMAIFVGGTAALAPEKTKDLTKVALRSLLAATLACMMTACIAGALISQA